MSDAGQTQAERDHDVLIDIRAKVEMILLAQQNFVHRDEMKPLLDREARCQQQFASFLSREEFEAKIHPIRLVVYGTCSLVFISVAVAILSLVIQGGNI